MSHTCPLCGQVGFSEAQLFEHVTKKYSDTGMHPECVSVGGGAVGCSHGVEPLLERADSAQGCLSKIFQSLQLTVLVGLHCPFLLLCTDPDMPRVCGVSCGGAKPGHR